MNIKKKAHKEDTDLFKKVEIPHEVMQWALEKTGWNEGKHKSLMEAADHLFKELIIEAFKNNDPLDPEDLIKPPEPAYTELELPLEVTEWAFDNLCEIRNLSVGEKHQEEMEVYFRWMIIRAYNRDVVG